MCAVPVPTGRHPSVPPAHITDRLTAIVAEMAYLRRPLVLRDTDAGPEVLWGVRHLWDSWPLQLTYTVQTCGPR
jgi:hypothetical protein